MRFRRRFAPEENIEQAPVSENCYFEGSPSGYESNVRSNEAKLEEQEDDPNDHQPRAANTRRRAIELGTMNLTAATDDRHIGSQFDHFPAHVEQLPRRAAPSPWYSANLPSADTPLEEENFQSTDRLALHRFPSGMSSSMAIPGHSSSSSNTVNTPSLISPLESYGLSDAATQYRRQGPYATYPPNSVNEFGMSDCNTSLGYNFHSYVSFDHVLYTDTSVEGSHFDQPQPTPEELLVDRDLFAIGGAFYVDLSHTGLGRFFLIDPSHDTIFRDMELQNQHYQPGRAVENMDRRRYGAYTGYQSGIPSLVPNDGNASENLLSTQASPPSFEAHLSYEALPREPVPEELHRVGEMEHDAWGEPNPEFYKKMQKDREELLKDISWA